MLLETVSPLNEATVNKVCFRLQDGSEVEYAYGDLRTPVKGDLVHAVGDDPNFPGGTYEVLNVCHTISLRGPRGVLVHIREVE